MSQAVSVSFQGQLAAIYIGERKGEALHAVAQVEALAGRGLTGDRYCRNEGTFSKPGSPDREVTLIESEALEAMACEVDIRLESHQARRNLLTQGVPLNHLVGKEFRVGDVVLKGIRLCEPCGHLESLTVKGVQDGLCHRGGLRAQILRGGVLHAGDPIRLGD
ncbi:MAG TPA: MOSC domain-containing protein [Gemmataceae bacterium]